MNFQRNISWAFVTVQVPWALWSGCCNRTFVMVALVSLLVTNPTQPSLYIVILPSFCQYFALLLFFQSTPVDLATTHRLTLLNQDAVEYSDSRKKLIVSYIEKESKLHRTGAFVLLSVSVPVLRRRSPEPIYLPKTAVYCLFKPRAELHEDQN